MSLPLSLALVVTLCAIAALIALTLGHSRSSRSLTLGALVFASLPWALAFPGRLAGHRYDTLDFADALSRSGYAALAACGLLTFCAVVSALLWLLSSSRAARPPVGVPPIGVFVFAASLAGVGALRANDVGPVAFVFAVAGALPLLVVALKRRPRLPRLAAWVPVLVVVVGPLSLHTATLGDIAAMTANAGRSWHAVAGFHPLTIGASSSAKPPGFNNAAYFATARGEIRDEDGDVVGERAQKEIWGPVVVDARAKMAALQPSLWTRDTLDVGGVDRASGALVAVHFDVADQNRLRPGDDVWTPDSEIRRAFSDDDSLGRRLVLYTRASTPVSDVIAAADAAAIRGESPAIVREIGAAPVDAAPVVAAAGDEDVGDSDMRPPMH